MCAQGGKGRRRDAPRRHHTCRTCIRAPTNTLLCPTYIQRGGLGRAIWREGGQPAGLMPTFSPLVLLFCPFLAFSPRVLRCSRRRAMWSRVPHSNQLPRECSLTTFTERYRTNPVRLRHHRATWGIASNAKRGARHCTCRLRQKGTCRPVSASCLFPKPALPVCSSSSPFFPPWRGGRGGGRNGGRDLVSATPAAGTVFYFPGFS